MTPVTLKLVDSGVSDTLKVTAASATAYTMCDAPSGKAWQVVGPGAGSADYTAIASC